MRATVRGILIGFVLFAMLPASTAAQRWGVAPRYLLNWGGPETRAGDINGYGLSLTHTFGAAQVWEVWGTYDHLEYDLETPLPAVGMEPGDPEPVDAFGTVHRGELDVVRFFRPGSVWQPFVLAGAGVYFIDVTAIDGVNEGGGAYHLVTESPTTGGVTVGIGSDVHASDHIAISFGFTYSQTFSKYQVTETESGRTGTIAPFAPLGLNVRLAYRL